MAQNPFGALTQSLGALAEFATDTITAPFVEPSIRLGVTGLSRAGKTVFITSMIHNLLLGKRLPLFSPAAERRLHATIIKPQPNLDLPRFAYEANIDGLLGTPPAWPEGTWRLSQLRLAISYKPKHLHRRLMGDQATLNVDIVDYPGEWLLDLPLLNKDFAGWSKEMLDAADNPIRRDLAAPWLKFLDSLDLNAPQNERAFTEAARQYTAYLRTARAEGKMLAYLQPGRFLMPGDMEGSPALTFCPLPVPKGGLKSGGFYRECERRFEAYKAKVIKPFFRDHFSKLDRQVVLTDLLGAAAAGPHAVTELQSAIETVLQSFRPGANTWLSKITEGKRIDKMLFACTKADHLPKTQHDRLAELLRDLTFEPANTARFKGAAIEFMTLASARTTDIAQVRSGGKLYDCITGYIEGQSEAKAFYPGELPANLTELKQGIDAPLAQVTFMPPPDLGRDGRGLEHIRLDRALDFLLGDVLT